MRSTSKQVIDLYERHARDWDADRRRARFVEKDWLNRFISFLPPGGSVLDLGCGGSEPMAGYLIGCKFSVTGIDSSPTMISLCRSRHPGQTWLVHDIRTLDLGRGFDGVIAWDSFFHLKPADQRKMFAVFHEHAAPSALLMFNAGPRHGEALGTYRGDPLYHASLDPAEYATLLDGIGFDIVAHVVEDPQAGGRTVWLARSRA